MRRLLVALLVVLALVAFAVPALAAGNGTINPLGEMRPTAGNGSVNPLLPGPAAW